MITNLEELVLLGVCVMFLTVMIVLKITINKYMKEEENNE